ncbi:MAG: aminotransferase [Aestuariivirga sp.]|nr:aminotransferase [Aestuariivirga sp.]
MSLSVSPAISRIEAPPISEAMTWVRPGARNRALLDLCQAVPSYAPAEALQAEIAGLARDPAVHLYTDIHGIPELRGALARHMAADYRGHIDPENVSITSGCNQAFCAAIMAVAQRGDNVVLPVPYYFNHQMWLDMLGVEKRVVAAFAEGRAYPLPEEMAAVIDDSTRAIVLCSPNNPTGAIYPPHVIEGFYDLAKTHGIALIIDETYKDFRASPEPLHGLFARPDWRDTFVQLYSFSKVFAMTGYRAGSIIAGAKVLAEAEKILDCIAICAPQISQRAALFGLANLADWKRGKQRLMETRRGALLAAFNNPRLAYTLISSGAYFAYVKHPFSKLAAKSVAMRLAGEHDVLCLPGSMFGPDQDSYLRFAFANSPAEDMPVLVERLIESQY